jgi:4-amino-4-deoxy-L-arabinose transferase-like glycosyltransferase
MSRPALESHPAIRTPSAPRPQHSSSSPWLWAALGAITCAAAALRLVYLTRVSPDPFYDAAVRSMGLSWHNFFFGAFEPSGSVSIDKPPVDLWLQVVSVKLLGFSSTTLKLPEVFAGTIAAPLLFETVRRMWNAAAGLAAAVALAVLPVEVITARSDTMDAVMMAAILAAFLFAVRAAESGRARWLYGAAALMGLAFNVKLLESLVALPALVVFVYLSFPAPRRRRLLALCATGAVYGAVALSWLTATLLFPAHDRPYAVGSTNGSAWNAAFVFNGTDRLGGKNPEPGGTVYEPGHRYPVATQSQRDHIPIVPPSPTRLLARIGPLSGERLGLELLAGLLLGIPALLWGALRARAISRAGRDDGRRARMPLAVAAGIGLWTLTGIVLFSHMTRLHPRYVEGFTPAVGAMLGIGLAWAASPGGRARAAVLGVTLIAVVVYAERLMYGTTATWWVTLLAALAAAACMALSRLERPAARARSALAPWGVIAFTLAAVLAVPFGEDVSAIRDGVTDAGYVGALPSEEQALLSAYVRAHQGSAKYELAAESATGIGSLVVSDARPVLVLTTYNARVFVPVPKLERLIAEGQVRYAFLNSTCTRHASSVNPACSAPVEWIRAHATDVSRAARLRKGLLWRLPGAPA